MKVIAFFTFGFAISLLLIMEGLHVIGLSWAMAQHITAGGFLIVMGIYIMILLATTKT